MIDKLADRRDHRRSPTKTTLSHIGNFLQRDLTLLSLKTKIILRNLHQRSPGDRRQDTAALRRHDLVVLRHEQEVGPASLLNLGTGSSIQIHIFIKSLIMSVHDSMQTHRIVKTRLDMTGSSRRRTVKITHAQSKRLYAALEVRTHRRGEYTELIISSRLNTDHRVDPEHVRTDIKRCPGTIGRYESLVGTHGLNNSIDEPLLRKNRHLQPSGRILKTFTVQVRTESNDTAILRGISL